LLCRDPGRFNMQVHNELVARYLPLSLQQRIRYRPGGEPAVVFHREQLLLLAKEALFHCTAAGRLWPPGDAAFARLLLMANDQMAYVFPDPADELDHMAQRIVQFIPVVESTGFSGLQHKVLRPYVMVTRFLTPEGRGLHFDIPSLFEAATRLPLRTYWAANFAVITRILRFDLNSFRQSRDNFGLDEAWHSRTQITAEHLSAFFSEISVALDALPGNGVPNVNDFTLFKSKPLFKFRDRVFPIDFAFTASKCESGMFWNVHDQLEPRDRPLFHSCWGEVFERYLNWVLKESVDSERNVFIANPQYAGREEEQVSDAIIRCGPDLVLLEYKGSTFTAAGKYGGDPAQLRREIESKLIGTEEDRKGLHQLAEAVKRIALKPRDAVKHLNLTGTRKIFPVLVTRDDLGGVMHINEYLNARFRSFLNRKEVAPISVTPLFCFFADECEIIANALKRVRLTEICEARYKRDPELRAPFSIVENAAIGSARQIPDVLKTEFDAFANMVKDELFPGWEAT
jgi:hypothetical protein